MSRYPGVKARGNSIRISYTYGGKHYRETLNLVPTPANMKLASLKRAGILFAIATNAFIPARNADATRTVEHALFEWLETKCAACSQSTYLEYKLLVDALVDYFGSVALFTFESWGERLQKWRDALVCGPKRVNALLMPLRGMCDREMRAGRIKVNPMEHIFNRNVRVRTAEPFNAQEVLQIIQNSGHDANLVQFAFSTGLRTAELIALTWDKVDLKGCKMYIDTTTVRGYTEQRTKTRSSTRTVDLLSPARAAVSAQRLSSSHRLVFCNKSANYAAWSPATLTSDLWRPTLIAAGVRYRNMYQTRHTFASLVLMGHFEEVRSMDPMARVMWLVKQMGHTNPQLIFQVYGKYLDAA